MCPHQPSRMSKRGLEADAEANPLSQKKPDLSTLSIFTYQGPLVSLFVPAARWNNALHVVLQAIFGSREDHSVFSITKNPEGSFLVMDEALYLKLFPTPLDKMPLWSCLYIHESSDQRSGAEISGSLSVLFDSLARERLPVLNVCTLRRNFMLVRQANQEAALATLRAAIEPTTAEASPAAATADGLAASAGVQLKLTRPKVAIGSLTLEQLKANAHALLRLLIIDYAPATFIHYFEMGGEISLVFEMAALEALKKEDPTSAAALSKALEPSIMRGWRVLAVTAPDGSDGFGILSAVCQPLASLPLMNISTLAHTFLLLPDAHVDAALSMLKPHFAVERASS